MTTHRMTTRAEAADERRMHEPLRRLQRERNTRLAQLTAMEADRPNANEELMTAQTKAIRLVLAEIDAAVERAKNGAYGDCQDCKVRIPVERLEILPYVRYCVRCQQLALDAGS
ncbi:TraR/DksA C4-type zinc finger protein [Kribbella sp. NPDC003505]|uniref:TraR/DksA family transcriptional regulator n=1 Tax=Kribbella sp. NPDC003505 TaxID=3154448 RepID=UPI0033B8F8AF